MARGEFVRRDVWDELDAEGFSLDAITLYIWSFTNPRCNMAGLYVIGERHMLNGKLPPKRLRQALDDLQGGGKMFYDAPLLWVKARVAHLHSKNSNYARSVAKNLGEVGPGHRLRLAFLDKYADFPWLKPALADLALESRKAETVATVSQGSPSERDSEVVVPLRRENG